MDGPRVAITCGNARFSLPTMPVEDYPTLPQMPTTVGTVSSDVFAAAVSQVAVAAGRDDTLPMLTGVRLEIDGERLTLAATDRYRLAVRELTWHPEQPGMSHAVLVPARTLVDAAKTLASGPELTLALSAGGAGEGMMGFAGTTGVRRPGCSTPSSRSTSRCGPRSPTASPSSRSRRSSRRSSACRWSPTAARRCGCAFSEGGVTLSAGGEDEGRAEESLAVTFEGEPITIAFNPTFLLDGVGAVDSDSARMSFTVASKPAVLSGKAEGDTDGEVDYRYLIMPVRLPG